MPDRLHLLTLAVCAACLGLLAPARALTTVDESITLDTGWNAIWLETTPVDSNGDALTPDEFFGAYDSIQFVASPSTAAASADFISDISETSFNTEEWLTWRPDDNIGGDTLGTVLGGRAYLIYTEGNSPTLEYDGLPAYNPPVWRVGVYNLRGFRVDDAGIQFGELFDGVEDIFPFGQIFSLTNEGNWESFSGSSDSAVESNRAYWIKCTRASSHMGPAMLDVGEAGVIDFGNGSGDTSVTIPADSNKVVSATLEDIQIENVSTGTVDVSFDRVDTESEFELYNTALSTTDLLWEGVAIGSGGGTASFSSMAAGEVDQLQLAAVRAWSDAPVTREALFDVNLGGVRYYLPLSAGTTAVSVTADSTSQPSGYTGLWVGEVTLDSVTNLTDSTTPLEDTTSQFVLPIILHVDGSGNVNLLSAVVMMQTKATSDDETPDPVLVINNELLGYYDGIQERNGKQVGVRIQSAAYDMPREMDTTTQADLADEVYTLDGGATYSDVSEVTEADLVEFVSEQDSRPSTLEESYYSKWPMTGTLGSGGSLQTASPLVLDPFHRSNPFRHAYHTKHLAGYQLSRVISLNFDTTDSANLLTGFYREDVDGLTQPDSSVAAGTQSTSKTISTTGRLVLRLVTTVDTLEE